MKIFISSLASKRLLLSVLLLFLAGMVFAVDVDFIPPQFSSSNPEYQDIIRILNDDLESAFSAYERQIKSDMAALPPSFPNLASAFANSSVFSSDGASQRGYEGFNAFSFTVGFMGALQLPKKFTLLDEIKDAIMNGEGDIDFDFGRDNMDMRLGLDLQILNAQFGLNTSFLLKGLYLGFKFSKFDTNWIKAMPLSGFSFNTMSIGVNASYQLISQKRILAGLFVWRGLNLGTGFIWQNTSLGLKSSLPIDKNLLNVSIPIPIGAGALNMQLDEVFNLDIKTSNFIVPIEAMTSIRLLGFLNLALGAGVDVAIGGSNINAHGSFDVIESSGLPSGINLVNGTPSLRYSLGGKSSPSLLNMKVMGALGFNFGPVLFDIPVTYYFLDNGYSLGFTLGVIL